jgi:hypothetical protein
MVTELRPMLERSGKRGGQPKLTVEDRLVQCGKFRLPSQRHLYQPGRELTVMVVDVAEMEIECPKKTETLL